MFPIFSSVVWHVSAGRALPLHFRIIVTLAQKKDMHVLDDNCKLSVISGGSAVVRNKWHSAARVEHYAQRGKKRTELILEYGFHQY